MVFLYSAPAPRSLALLLVLLAVLGSAQGGGNETEAGSNETTCRSGGPADAICPCSQRCELRVVLADQANTNCTCFVTPSSAGIEEAPSGKIILILNTLSLVLGTLVLIPFLRLKKKKTFPSNMVPHMMGCCFPLHLVYLATDYNLYTVYFPYNEDDRIQNFNISPTLCILQTSMAYFSALVAVSLCMFVSISFFQMIVRGHKMKRVAKGRTKMLAFSYGLGISAPICANAGASVGVYAVQVRRAPRRGNFRGEGGLAGFSFLTPQVHRCVC